MSTGNRRAVPADALKICPTCGEHRGNRRTGWGPIFKGEEIVGYSCPACPTWDEPIRRIESGGRVRFRVVVDASPRGTAKRKQVTKTLDSLDDARAFVDHVRSEVNARGSFSRNDETVAQLCERWLASKTDVRAISLESYRYQLKPVVRHLGDTPVRDLTAADLRGLVTWMTAEGGRRPGKGLGPLAVKHALGRLGTALDMAVEDGIIERNVARAGTIKRPRSAKATGEALEHWPTTGRGPTARCEPLGAFRRTADTDRLAAAWRLTLCGLTRADVLGLQWGDIDLDAGTVTIRRGRVPVGDGDRVDIPKSSQRRRTVPFEEIQPGTTALLRAYSARVAQERLAAGSGWERSPFVFVDEVGVPVKPRAYGWRFAALCKTAGVPVIRLHSVRHSLAFLLHALGVAPADAAALLGHTLEVHLSTYMPEGGASGIKAAASALASLSARGA